MRTLRLTALAILAMILVALGSAHAGVERAGTTSANFLSLGSGARTLSMGGATLGLGDDISGAGWNAAALGWVEDPEVALSHLGLQNNSLQEWASYGARVANSQTRWAMSGTYQGNGSFDGRDANGFSTGSFSASSIALGAMVSQQIGGMVTLGAGTKYVNEKLGDVSGSGLTFDLGLMVRRGPLGLGFSAQNLAGTMKYGAASYPFPTSYGGGIAYTHARSGLRFALDANVPNAYHPDVRAGVEWNYRGMAALRTGYRKEVGSTDDPLSGASFGVGAGHNGMWLDYGYLLANDGGEHRLGLRFRLGRGHDSDTDAESYGATAEPSAHYQTPKDPSFIGPPPPKGKH